MSTNPFGSSNSFGTPAEQEPAVDVVEEAPKSNRRLAVVGAAAGVAVLAAAGVWFGIPALTGAADDVAAVDVPVAAAPADPATPAETDTDTELPILTSASGRNPFLPLLSVTDTGASLGQSVVADGTAPTDVSSGSPGSSGSTSTDVSASIPEIIAGPAGAAGAAGAAGPAGPAGANGVDGVTPEYATVTYTGQSTTDPSAATFNIITMQGPATVSVRPAGATNPDGSTSTGVLDTTGLTSASFLAYLGLDTDATSRLSYAKLQFGDSQVYRGFQDFPLSFFTPTTAQ